MLELIGVRKNFGDRDILRGVSLHVSERQRIALVGANGVGKSTLLKIILRETEPDGGEVRLAPWATVAYLPQDARCTAIHSLREELLSVFAPVREVEARQRDLEAQMHRLAPDEPRLMALIAEHSHLHEEFERRDGYTIETEIGKVLAGLGFSPGDPGKAVCDFSGGWQMRIALAKLLLQRPSLLLLDEPTNHLDIPATAWLEEYLREYRGGVIAVSHDRYFLDRIGQRTLELDDGVVREWAGNYSWYVAEKTKQLAIQESAYERQQEYLVRQQAFVERFRASARRSAQAKSRERAMEKLERVEAPKGPTRGGRFRFAYRQQSGREVFTLKGVSKAYDGQTVFQGVELLVERNDRVALVGENGTGKTTLLRLLGGAEQPDAGSIRVGLNVQRSYYSQHQADSLDVSKTVLDEVYGAAPGEWTLGEVRSLLGRFGIGGDDVFKPISVLSGGERSRVALAKMLLRPANVLLLDEPTNHLDIPAREMLEHALRAYQGTVVLVSHDRYFIDKVATKVVELGGEAARLYGGNYTHYLSRKAKEKEADQTAVASAALARPKTAEPRRAASFRQPSLQKQVTAVEAEISAVEADLKRLTDAMASPESHEHAERAIALLGEYQEADHRLAELNERWEALARALEEAEITA